jgi:hypothetical protein
MDRRIISVKYFGMYTGAEGAGGLDSDLNSMSDFCREFKYTNVGILPWKILRADFHTIDKVPGYLDKYYAKIVAIVDTITKCRATQDNAAREQILLEFAQKIADW